MILRIIITPFLKIWYYFKYPTITLRNDTSLGRVKSVLIVKGFASGFDESADNKRLCEDFLRWAKANLPREAVVSFDGDKFNKLSYTKIVPRLKEIRPDIQVIAFMQWHDSYSRADNWKHFEFPITFYLTPPFPDYNELGRHAIAITGSKTILCFGGGPTVLSEFNRSLPYEKWYVWEVSRPDRKDKNKRCNGSLFDLEEPSLTHFF